MKREDLGLGEKADQGTSLKNHRDTGQGDYKGGADSKGFKRREKKKEKRKS